MLVGKTYGKEEEELGGIERGVAQTTSATLH